jgi:hypothetical protein
MLREFVVFHSTHRAQKVNGWRPCGDYRALKVWTTPNHYPVCNIHDYSHQLFGCSVFSKIILVTAYKKLPTIPTT